METTQKNNRFSVLDVTDSTNPTENGGDGASASPVRGETIDVEGKDRAQEDEKAAVLAGFTPRPPIYAVGTMVVEAGVENFRQSRLEFEALPSVGDAVSSLVEQVAAEKRRDVEVKVPTLKYALDGKLVVPGADGDPAITAYPMSERAFDTLCAQFTPGMAGYGRNLGVLETDPDGQMEGLRLRAENLNHWLPRALRVDKRATKKQMKTWATENFKRFSAGKEALPKPKAKVILAERVARLRLRQIPGNEKGSEKEEIFAIVGPRYSVFDVDQIAEQINCAVKANPVLQGSRCTILYNGYKAQFDVLFHSNITPEKAVAGEFFKAGIRITTADDGSGAIKVQTLLWRNLCLNFIVIDVAKVTTLSRRHIGENIAKAIETGIADAIRRVDYFIKKWDESTLENVLERYGIENEREVYERLVANKVVWVPGYSAEDLVDRLVTAHAAEPGWGKEKFVNAVSRIAHAETWKSAETASDLEAKAGELLFAKVWNVEAKPETEEEALGW